MRSFAMSIYSGDVVSKDVLKSFRNLLGGGAKKLDEDLDIRWASKGGNVDLSSSQKMNSALVSFLITSIANMLVLDRDIELAAKQSRVDVKLRHINLVNDTNLHPK